MTIDAIGCQKNFTELIIDQKADYIIGLKPIKDDLFEQVADWFDRTKPTLQADVSRDVGHGRAVKRTVRLSENVRLTDTAVDWWGLKSVVCVESSRWLKGKHQHNKCF